MNPLTALIFGISFLVIVFILFIPNNGLIPWLKRMKKNTEKELLEDILKYLYNSEYNNRKISFSALSKELKISHEYAGQLNQKLIQMNLVKIEQDNLVLTGEGKSYALRIIRIHRLWEKYLADHTSIKETEWHNLAETKEHELSSEETNRLAAKLGNPLHDPHGDPIPTDVGEMPVSKGILLTELTEGQFGRIIHIEDEPKEQYAQLIAMKLYPGMQIRIIERSDGKISIEADGEECRLAFMLAANITVIPLLDKEIIFETFISLSSIKQGESAEVISISNALRGQQRRRLLDLGIVPGTKITAQLKSLSGDPTAYEIRGASIALRKNQSDHIFIKKVETVV